VREEIADVLQFAHAGDRVADTARPEIRQRQRQQVAEQPGSEFNVDAVGGVREDISTQVAEDCLEQRNRQQAGDDDVERGQAAVHQHLVDHHLEEQR